MARNRKSAKDAGSSFERSIADCLDEHLPEPVDRLVKTGAKDRGDIGGVTAQDRKVAIECKDYAGQIKNLPQTLREVEAEKVHYDAPLGVAIYKRRGTTDPLKQYVIMEVGEFIDFISG